MAEFFINVFIYTFAILGVVVFFDEMIEMLNKSKNSKKIALMLEKDSDSVEMEVTELIKALDSKGINYFIYIINKNEDDESTKIIEAICRKNAFCTKVDRDELIKVLET